MDATCVEPSSIVTLAEFRTKIISGSDELSSSRKVLADSGLLSAMRGMEMDLYPSPGWKTSVPPHA